MVRSFRDELIVAGLIDEYKVSYDDAETLDLKRTFANSKCLGGRFVWSVDLDNATSKEALVDLSTSGLKLLGDDVSSNPSYALDKLSAISSQNSVNLYSYWTACSAAPQCNAGYSQWTLGHGKVYDADKGIYTADGCHGGGNGYNRALCVEADVTGVNCKWYGRPGGCSQTCPSGTILLAQTPMWEAPNPGANPGISQATAANLLPPTSLMIARKAMPIVYLLVVRVSFGKMQHLSNFIKMIQACRHSQSASFPWQLSHYLSLAPDIL